MVVIKFENGTYHAGCGKSPAKTLAGAQIYRSEKAAMNVILNSVNFHTPADRCFIIEVELKERSS